MALVVGNGGYRSVERLANPANDARLIAGTLQQAGFTLIGDGPQLDLDKAGFDRGDVLRRGERGRRRPPAYLLVTGRLHRLPSPG